MCLSYFLFEKGAIVTTFVEICDEFIGVKGDCFVSGANAAKVESHRTFGV